MLPSASTSKLALTAQSLTSWVLACHRDPAPNVRPAELVTKLDWVPDRDPREIGAEIVAQKHLHPPTNCSGCHR